MSRLLTLAAGPRAKWIVLACWLGAIFAFSALQWPTKFDKVQKNESTSFLPEKAESTKALVALKEIQRGNERVTMVVVYRNPDGLTAANRATIASVRDELNGLDLPDTKPFGPPVFSKDGTGALLTADIVTDGQGKTIRDPVERVRDAVRDPGGGMEVKVTGSAGYSADGIKIFENINGTLLLAALLLVVVLLIIIYRSPVFWLIPLTAVGFAEITSRSLGYLVAKAGVTVNGQSSSILSILVLGAGTDYALLLVARYREELRREPDRHVALATALRTAGPAIVASGVTVMIALLCLTVADVNGTAGLGPIGAMAIAIAMISMLTLLPALLAIFGRWPFWPFIPHLGDTGSDAMHGPWRRMGERIAGRPRPVWIGAAAVLAVMCLGWLAYSSALTQGNSFRGDVESVQGQKLLSKAFPSGANAPTDVIVPAGGDVDAVKRAAAGVDGVDSVAVARRSPSGTQLAVTLRPDPYSTAAFDAIPKLRAATQEAGGPQVLVGGPTAVERDLRHYSTRDTKVIIPLVLLVVLLVLIVLLRAVLAPLLLVGTVILSFFAALGTTYVVSDWIFGFPGSDPSLPLFAFVFLVALGIDYNIFLMARVREETLTYGTRAGMIRGLAMTGGVITSAGIVLAGTFAVLGVLPLVFLTELGFAIAFGVLLDTFLVRSVLVPALVLDIGQRVWWPSRLAHEGEPGGTTVEAEHEDRPVQPAVS